MTTLSSISQLRQSRLMLAGTVNATLQNSSILHATLLERLKTSEVDSIIKFLNGKVFPDIANTLERRMSLIKSRGFDTGPWTTRQYRSMMQETNTLIKTGMRAASKTIADNLKSIGVYEANFQSATIQQAIDQAVGTGVIPNITTPSIPILRSIATSSPFQGKFLKEWFDGLAESTQANLASQVNIGIVTGEPTKRIVQRVMGTRALNYTDGVLATSRRQATTIVRTAINHVTTQARELTYKDNKSVIKGVRYLATLDSRTSDICASLDGQVFNVLEGPRPPMHHQCRSTTVPVTKSWKELGIKLKEAKVGTRASMNGQVPANTGFSSWLKAQPISIQNEVLGKGRAELFRRGTVPMKRFIDNKFRPLTLKQLQQLEHTKLTTGRFPRRKTVTKKPATKRKRVAKRKTKTAVKQVSQVVARQVVTEATTTSAATGEMTGAELRSVMNARFSSQYDDVVAAAQRKTLTLEKEYVTMIEENIAFVRKVNAETRSLRGGAEGPLHIEYTTVFRPKLNALRDRYNLAGKEYEKLIGTMREDLHKFLTTSGEGLHYNPIPVERGLHYAARGGRLLKTMSTKPVLPKVEASQNFLSKIVKHDAAGLRNQGKHVVGGIDLGVEGLSDYNMIVTRATKGARANASASGSRVRGAGRAGDKYRSKNNMIASTNDDIGVFVHETGHLIEESNRVWSKKVHEFMQSRIVRDIEAQGLIPQQYVGKKLPEHVFRDLAKKAVRQVTWNGDRGWIDEFMNPYTGRWYGTQTTGTELTSMALEALYTDPMALARLDPELFDFIMNLARNKIGAIEKMAFNKVVPAPHWKTLQSEIGTSGF